MIPALRTLSSSSMVDTELPSDALRERQAPRLGEEADRPMAALDDDLLATVHDAGFVAVQVDAHRPIDGHREVEDGVGGEHHGA